MPNPHLETDWLELGAGPASAKATVVLLHGRGGAYDDGDPVAPILELAEEIGTAETHYLVPVAAEASWYPGRYRGPVDDNQPELDWALDAVREAIRRSAGPVALVGFSQGACIAAELIARDGPVVPAAALLTGSTICLDPMAPRDLPSLARFSVFLGIARTDEWVAHDDAKATADAFRAAGANAEFRAYDDDEHGWNVDEVTATRELIAGLGRLA